MLNFDRFWIKQGLSSAKVVVAQLNVSSQVPLILSEDRYIISSVEKEILSCSFRLSMTLSVILWGASGGICYLAEESGQASGRGSEPPGPPTTVTIFH